MPRQLRIEYPGAIYHVMNRGDRRDASLLDNRDCVRFLDIPGEVGIQIKWRVPA